MRALIEVNKRICVIEVTGAECDNPVHGNGKIILFTPHGDFVVTVPPISGYSIMASFLENGFYNFKKYETCKMGGK